MKAFKAFLFKHHKEVWKENFNIIFFFVPDWDGKG